MLTDPERHIREEIEVYTAIFVSMRQPDHADFTPILHILQPLPARARANEDTRFFNVERMAVGGIFPCLGRG